MVTRVFFSVWDLFDDNRGCAFRCIASVTHFLLFGGIVMQENIISKILAGIGIGTIGLGILAFLIIGTEAKSIAIFIGGIVGSFILGMMFIGFSEIIGLLQQNVDKQSKIIEKMNEKPKVVKEILKEETKTVLQDIESNLPKI